jgi:hypothetical protein
VLPSSGAEGVSRQNAGGGSVWTDQGGAQNRRYRVGMRPAWTDRCRAQNIAPRVPRRLPVRLSASRCSTVSNDRGVVIETRRAGVDDLGRASQVLGEAFASYPWTRWTVDPDDHQERITRLQLLALENLGMAFGEVWLRSVDSTIESVAVWMDSAVAVPSSVHHAMEATVASSSKRTRGLAASPAPLYSCRARHGASEATRGLGGAGPDPRRCLRGPRRCRVVP